MSDPHSRARDGDRKRAVERVDAAYADGLISAADRALRVGNIENAETLGELDLVVRDLRSGQSRPQPPPQMPPSAPPSPQSGPAPGPPPSWVGAPQTFRLTPQRRSGTAVPSAAIVVIALVVLISVAGSFMVSLVGGMNPIDDFPGGDPITGFAPTEDPTDEPTDGPIDKLALTAAGLRWFVGRYEDQFGTTRALRLVIRADRASIELPVDGGRRHQRWEYADDEFENYGGTVTNSQGTSVVDLRRLRLQPLVANIRRAKRVLGVERPSTIYVIVGDDTLGDQPEARIYVSNKFNESGYLATSFAGRVLRSFPFEG